MRLAYCAVVLTLCGCAAEPTLQPREYLDEETAATIKVAAEPLVFAVEPGAGVRDFLNVYAIDVNRMGTHQQYLAAVQWWPVSNAPVTALELQVAGQTLVLPTAQQPAREIGIAQAIDPSAPREGAWHYFTVNKAQLAAIAGALASRATLIQGEQRLSYALWRDNRPQVAELTDELP